MFSAELSDRALIRVAGPDARVFLHNLLTQDVESITPGELRYGALLTPQGRLLHEVFLLGEADGVLLDTPAPQGDALLGRLKLYKLRAKVTFDLIEEPVFAAWTLDDVAGASPGPEWPADPRAPGLGRRAYAPPGVSASGSLQDYQAHRLAQGVADPLQDLPEDRTYPIEANFDLLNGIDFRKGCFIGQETTSRMKRRGTIKTRLVPISFDGEPPPIGAEVLAGELRAGEVRSGMTGRALALLRLDRSAAGGLTVGERIVRLAPPSWLQSALQPPESVRISERRDPSIQQG